MKTSTRLNKKSTYSFIEELPREVSLDIMSA